MSDLEVDVEKDLLPWLKRRLLGTWAVALPGKVGDHNRDLTRATFDFAVMFVDTARAGRAEPQSPPLPVVWPGGDGYGFQADMATGDLGVALACDREVAGFYEDGTDVDPSAGGSGQGHSYGCGVLFPGGRVSSSAPGQATPPPNTAGTAVVGSTVDASARLTFRRQRPQAVPPELGSAVLEAAGPIASILLGSLTAAVPVTCAPAVLANLQGLNTVIQGIPATGLPPVDAAITSFKAAAAAWVATLQPMADLKVMVDGPTP